MGTANLWLLRAGRRRRGGRPLSRRALLPGWEVPFTPPAPPGGISVVSVSLWQGGAGDALLWRFSEAVVATGPDVPNLEASPDGSGWVPATTVEVAEDGAIFAVYDGAFLTAGSAWRIAGPTPGLTFASGAALNPGDSGTVSA